jgi:hypothetical protein
MSKGGRSVVKNGKERRKSDISKSGGVMTIFEFLGW